MGKSLGTRIGRCLIQISLGARPGLLVAFLIKIVETQSLILSEWGCPFNDGPNLVVRQQPNRSCKANVDFYHWISAFAFIYLLIYIFSYYFSLSVMLCFSFLCFFSMGNGVWGMFCAAFLSRKTNLVNFSIKFGT